MKVLLTGGRGMLGRTLCAELTDFEIIPTDLRKPTSRMNAALTPSSGNMRRTQ